MGKLQKTSFKIKIAYNVRKHVFAQCDVQKSLERSQKDLTEM